MCGIAAVFNAPKAAEWTVIGLHGNQHRAIDYAGIVSSDGSNSYRHVGEGIARKVFDDAATLNKLHGRHALGHIRYPTVDDDPTRENIQPIMGNYGGRWFALAHNGNLTNGDDLLRRLNHRPMKTSMDTELIVRLIEQAHSGNGIVEDLQKVAKLLKGSFALAILFSDMLIAVQDPHSNRPLSLGRKEESWFLSSETVAFSGLGAEFVRELEPAEILLIESPEGPRSTPYAEAAPRKCRFEGNYFSHPASSTFGESVTRYRKELGRALEEAHPAQADIVVGIPDSARFIAMGYAKSGRSGEYDEVIVRSHYVGRTFIAANQAKRDAEVAQKFAFNADGIKGNRIALIDDSIVRGTTLPKVVSELRRCGATQVHVRIGTPPILHPCRYGINTPKYSELISVNRSRAEICKMVGADSLEFLPIDIQKRISKKPEHFCFACLDGNYW